ncbi:class I SAM-dependent methyltransferase [Bacillus benzoevorans]|uniref:Trans-aconitate methyltransferase n=1 Tax=Bacillus benzoevorans TaxID=1456 RepID=A0A7X0LVM6_9BACI|nr:class I SAM-dependent methyltransferase [Bacillus benzoevorans]MBB6445783.1 trans-aconitate methyltransferase [Bacillus benzoevorans]
MEKMNSAKDIWNAGLYDGKHSFVSKYGSGIMELLAPLEGEKILDLGCGTGDLAKKLFDRKIDVIGVDQSENMIQQAKEKYPHIPFKVEDAAKLNYQGEFDAVFSNATLHWVKQAQEALHSIYHSLKQGGRFVAEFGGKGNVQTITDAIIAHLKIAGITYQQEQFPWYYPSIAEYTSLMEEAGFRVTFAQHFDRPTPLDGEDGLRNWIKMFGSQLLNRVETDKQNRIILNVEEQVREKLYADGRWTADYKRIRVIGVKE